MRTTQVLLNIALLMICLGINFSCNEDTIRQSGIIIRPISNPAIAAEIRSMVGEPEHNNQTGRTKNENPPPLPSGFDYNNLTEVIIPGAGTNMVTYVAYHNTENYSDYKEMVGIYYQNGVMKNWLYSTWEELEHPNGNRFIVRYRSPQNTTNYVQAYMQPTQGTVSVSRIHPPGECGQAIMNCLDHFYVQSGWASLGLTLLSIAVPAAAVGAVAGCMASCMLWGPIW